MKIQPGVKTDLESGYTDWRFAPSTQPRNFRGRFAPGGAGCIKGEPFDRFVAKVEPLKSGCWRWSASFRPNGYGQFVFVRGDLRPAHRLSYEWFIGPVPADLVLDHLCRNRWCVNPTHVEPVTQAVNSNRGLNRKVSDEVALRILAVRPRGPKRAKVGTGARAVAEYFGTTPTTVYRIWTGGVTYLPDATRA